MGKEHPFRWYKIVGHPVDGPSIDFTYYVESVSPRNVIKYHGNRRRCYTEDGPIVVQFPSHEKDVHTVPVSLLPEQFAEPRERDSKTIVRVFPATHYVCECGKEHISDFPYRSMWCRCGKKAMPVENTMSSVVKNVQPPAHPLNTAESNSGLY